MRKNLIIEKNASVTVVYFNPIAAMRLSTIERLTDLLHVSVCKCIKLNLDNYLNSLKP